MRNGHYTLRDISGGITVVEPRAGEVRSAYGVIKTESEKIVIRCLAGHPEWDVKIEWHEGKMLRDRRETWKRESHVNTVPPKFAVVAEAIRKKSGTHGGRRWYAGRKKSVPENERRRPRSFSLSDAEYARVKKYV